MDKLCYVYLMECYIVRINKLVLSELRIIFLNSGD